MAYSLKGKPHYRRTQQVYAVLDASPSDATYDRLIEYVRQSTGQGCSRKLISKWKKLTIQDRAYPRANAYSLKIRLFGIIVILKLSPY